MGIQTWRSHARKEAMTMGTAADGDVVFRLMYRSRNLIPTPARKAELGHVFSKARSHNKGVGVTGALLVAGDWFVQVLEGEEVVVRSLYDVIASDARHAGVELVETVPGVERAFGRWSMARVAADGEPDVPLIAHVDGIAPAAARSTTPAQEGIVAQMHRAASAELPA
jgi:hypothetical protein